MQIKNLSISLPDSLIEFIEKYKVSHDCQSSSFKNYEVIREQAIFGELLV